MRASATFKVSPLCNEHDGGADGETQEDRQMREGDRDVPKA